MTYNDFLNKVSALLLYDSDNPDVESDNYINQLVRSWMSEMQFYVDNFKVKNENTYTETDFEVECKGARISLPPELEKLVKVEFKYPEDRCEPDGLPPVYTVSGAGTAATNLTYLANGEDFEAKDSNGDVIYTLERLVDAMVVEGAGTVVANGVYLRAGFFGSKARYATDTHEIFWDPFSGDWNIRQLGFLNSLYSSSEDTDTPDLVSSWTAESGTLPVPAVRRATLSDAGITAAVLTWSIVDDLVNIVYSNPTNSLTPPEDGWVTGTGTAPAPTVTQATWEEAIEAGYPKPEGCYTDCQEVIPMKPIRWDDRNDLTNPERGRARCYSYAVDKRATTIYVNPYPKDDATDGAESIVVTWEGVKQDYNGTDEVPFGFDCIKNCSDYVNAELARKKEDKLQRYNSFYESYLRGRLPIYRAQEDKDEQRA